MNTSTSLPLISIVTPSFNQADYLRETLQSLVDQDYPNLEVVIQEAGSTDGSIDIIKTFTSSHPDIFRLHVEADRGQAHALNLGFAKFRGEIMGFLNSDDLLYPGCLHRVASEIDPAKGRFVVMGRCLFTGEGSAYVGVEHPAVYTTHFEHLAIWKRGHNTIPQPSVFWHRRVWEKCGGFNETEQHVLDYDLFCRFSQKYHFHRIDELFSAYRMHPASKSSNRTETEILEMSIAVSRRYWGGWWQPLRWRCMYSHWRHSDETHERARHHARVHESAIKNNRYLSALGHFLATAFYSPRMTRERLLLPWLAKRKIHFIERWFLDKDGGFAGRYDDGWIGPYFKMTLSPPPPEASGFLIELVHSPQGAYRNVTTTIHLNRRKLDSSSFSDPDVHKTLISVEQLGKQPAILEIRSSSHFVPRMIHNTPDDRQLSLILSRSEWQ